MNANTRDRVARAFGTPLAAVLILLVGMAGLTAVSVHYAHKDAAASAAGDAFARRRVAELRRGSDDILRQNNGLIRELAADRHLPVPPPLPPEPSYDLIPASPQP